MDHNDIFAKLPAALLRWYYNGHRELPWRQDKDPYHIWLSEIMLQQTRVEAVRGYYTRFLDKLPTIPDLANADDDLLHKLWEGLGYYSRVRNLKKAAQILVNQYNGSFPSTYREVIALPGIGKYTAGAICSIAYDLPTPAVDGNVLRVITRLTNDQTSIDNDTFKISVANRLETVYPTAAGDFTQALMELGATVCGPNRKADCGNCPCRDFCLACANGTTEDLPVRKQKKARKEEKLTVFILSCDGYYAIEKRDNKGLLADLWQFPNVSQKLELVNALTVIQDWGIVPKEVYQTSERKHIFTHIQWNMTGIYVEVKEKTDKFLWLTAQQITTDTALPTAFRQFWDARPNL